MSDTALTQIGKRVHYLLEARRFTVDAHGDLLVDGVWVNHAGVYEAVVRASAAVIPGALS